MIYVKHKTEKEEEKKKEYMSLASRADCLIANSVIFMRNSIDKCITTVRRKEIMLKKKKENRVKRQKYPLFFNRIWFFFYTKKNKIIIESQHASW